MIDISDLRDLQLDLGRAGPEVLDDATDITEKTGHDVVAGAQAGCPVDTGYLRSTISADFDPDGLGFDAGPSASYGGYVELGTSRMSPQPYLFPAFDGSVPPAIDAYADAAERSLLGR